MTVADIIVLAFAIVTVVLAVYMIAEAWLGRNEPTEDAPQPAEPKANALATMAATEMLREEFANRPYDWETEGL